MIGILEAKVNANFYVAKIYKIHKNFQQKSLSITIDHIDSIY